MQWKNLLMTLMMGASLGFTGAAMSGCEADVDEKPDGYEVEIDRDRDWDGDREIKVDVD